MQQEQIATYLNYLEERGQVYVSINAIESFVAENSDQTQVDYEPFIGKNPRLLVWVETQELKVSRIPAEEKLLLAKILQALSVSFQDALIFPTIGDRQLVDRFGFSELIQKHGISSGIIFGKKPSELPVVAPCLSLYSVCSLDHMVKDQSKKIQTWQTLKQIKLSL